MGLKMNGLNPGLANALNGGFKNKQDKNQFLNAAKRQQQQHQQLAANLLTQGPLSFNKNFLPNGINGLPNLNPFFPMPPKYGNCEDYAALLAQFQNPFYMMNPSAAFPYNFQNFLKFTAGAQDNPLSDLPKQDEDNQNNHSPTPQSEHDDMVEEVPEEHNESEPRLIMDLQEDEKNSFEDVKDPELRTSTPVQEENHSDEQIRMKYENDGDNMDQDHDLNNRSRSPSPIGRNELSQGQDQDESNMSDDLRCRNCNKSFNHQTELVQHEKMLCNSLFQKQEDLVAHINDSFNGNYLPIPNPMSNGINISEDENDDRESKVSTESERKVRVRTAISEDQQSVLKEFYALNSRPNREEFRQIANRLNLDARVVQVWFQNNRSRERKMNGMFKPVQPGFLYSPPPPQAPADDQPLDLSVKKEKLNATPSTSPRYGTVPLQQSPDEAINLSRKSDASPPAYRPFYNYSNGTPDLLARQIPSPNEAVPRPQNQNLRNGYALPYGLPFDRLLQFTPEMARNPLLLMRNDQRGNSLSPGSSEKRSWNNDDTRHYDEEFRTLIHQQQQQLQQHPPTKRAHIAKIKAELPPDSDGLFVCDQCDKAFSKQSSLARHKYEHSGEFAFETVKIFKLSIIICNLLIFILISSNPLIRSETLQMPGVSKGLQA
jgi:zinc finger homeobox protein 1/2